jgi:hypothetical protein
MTILYEKCELCLLQPKLNKICRPRAFQTPRFSDPALLSREVKVRDLKSTFQNDQNYGH